MEHSSSRRFLKIGVSQDLFERLNAFAKERNMSPNQAARLIINRTLGVVPISQRTVENSLGFVHLAVDAILRHGYHPEVREEVLTRHRWLRRQLAEADPREEVRP